jgi:predicted Rdx family selenoprotein
MKPGSGGIFAVTLNDDLLYTNDGSGYFPTREEIDRALETRLGLAGEA